MPKYIVVVKEVWNQPVEVEADSPTEAKQKVLDGEGYIIEDWFEYSFCLGPETWAVEEARVAAGVATVQNDGRFITQEGGRE